MSDVVPLGSGRARALGIPGKAWRLDAAKAAGLPVPDGWVLTDGADASASPARERDRRVAVRSAFGGEDDESSAGAGRFVSVLDVSLGDDRAFAAAVGRVRASSRGAPATMRRDVLVLDMIAPITAAGVAFCECAHEDDLVEWIDDGGAADALLAGTTRGRTRELARLRSFERPDRSLEPVAQRLQALLRDVRRVFGASADWDVEWADDGACCWLLQVRPITRAAVRDEWFTTANHKEILPDPPSRFMAGVLAANADALYAWYRRLDPTLPSTRPFLELFDGRPRINLSLLLDTMRAWGLPTRLVSESIGGGGEPAVGVRWRRLVRKLPVLLRMAGVQARSVGIANRAARRIDAWTAAPIGDFAAGVSTLGRVYVELVHGMMALTGAMSVPLAVLDRLGVLAAHSARHVTVSTELAEALATLRRDVRRAADESRARAAVDAFLDRFGHRGVFESDVAEPRWRECPDRLIASLRAGHDAVSPPRRSPPLGLLGWLTMPLWWVARRPLAARERLRHEAMRGFERVRRALLAHAATRVARGRLPSIEAIWTLSPDELVALDADDERSGAIDEAVWRGRVAERDAARQVATPDLFRRFAPQPLARVDAAEAWRGQGLTRGTVEGVAWVARRPDDPVPLTSNVDDPLILVAPALDPGWFPLLAGVAGAVVETGGRLSHASITIRELGLPAVVNAPGVVVGLRTGDRIRVHADRGVVERLPSERDVATA